MGGGMGGGDGYASQADVLTVRYPVGMKDLLSKKHNPAKFASVHPANNPGGGYGGGVGGGGHGQQQQQPMQQPPASGKVDRREMNRARMRRRGHAPHAGGKVIIAVGEAGGGGAMGREL